MKDAAHLSGIKNPKHVKRQAVAGTRSGSGMLGNDNDFRSAASHSRADVQELKQNSDLMT